MYFLGPFSNFNDEKLRYKCYNERISTRDNSNVQPNEQEESKLKSTIIAISCALPLTDDKMLTNVTTIKTNKTLTKIFSLGNLIVIVILIP